MSYYFILIFISFIFASVNCKSNSNDNLSDSNNEIEEQEKYEDENIELLYNEIEGIKKQKNKTREQTNNILKMNGINKNIENINKIDIKNLGNNKSKNILSKIKELEKNTEPNKTQEDIYLTIAKKFKKGGYITNKNKKYCFEQITKNLSAENISKDIKKIKFLKKSLNNNETINFDNLELKRDIKWKNVAKVKASNTPIEFYDSNEADITFQVNFADEQLFGYYKGPLLAQEETLAIEMPILPIWIEKYKIEKNLYPTIETSKSAAIFLDVARYGNLDTKGIYGNAFATKTYNELKNKIKVIKNHKYHNILCIAAPNLSGTPHTYSFNEFKKLCITAYCGFKLIKDNFQDKSIVCKTGNWGAGAFGNDLRASAIAQVIAAYIAGIKLEIYPMSQINEWNEAEQIFDQAISSLNSNSQKLTPKSIFAKCLEISTIKSNGELSTTYGNGT